MNILFNEFVKISGSDISDVKRVYFCCVTLCCSWIEFNVNYDTNEMRCHSTMYLNQRISLTLIKGLSMDSRINESRLYCSSLINTTFHTTIELRIKQRGFRQGCNKSNPFEIPIFLVDQ